MSSPIDSKGSCLLLICLPAVSRLLTLTYVAEDSDDLRLESELPERLREACNVDTDANSDDDEDDELEGVPFGYEQLPQDEDEGVSLDQDDQQDRVLEAPSITLDKSEELPEETANTIKSIMSKIQIPESAIPDWAKDIPESEWMPQLVFTSKEQKDDHAQDA
ncbi:hypothetical protein VTP01DRAFT_4233 [Rhizomucor pusillus]|uniref:uncharacterized protein n=1 Tax=Rhizomucor pusillus TaxID=4840 RepID=UPI0037426DCF